MTDTPANDQASDHSAPAAPRPLHAKTPSDPDAGERTGLLLDRYFTRDGVHPHDELTWERRDAVLTNWRDGTTSFEQRDVEFPSTWSLNATTIVAQKYFRGELGTPERESSVRAMVDRVAGTVAGWGREDGYFADERSAEVFEEELTHLLVNQKAAFNSPVWFNVGVPGNDTPQCSACYILSVEDEMTSILNWYVEEGLIFKGGSGAGVNISRIRSHREKMTGGGEPSGPVSFMRGADASAGTIRSGGTTRRAAKMVVLDVDHPDIEEFIETKRREEDKIRALRDAGFDVDLDGADGFSVQYQNANNSVRVTDDFMQAYLEDRDYATTARTTGEVVERKPAREVMRRIAEAAWECADPGMQYDTTVNDWHTSPVTGRINGSNPCCFAGDTLVETVNGPVRFDLLEKMHQSGDDLPMVQAYDIEAGAHVLRPVTNVWVAGRTRTLVEVRTWEGLALTCTPEHRFLTADGEYVAAALLEPDTDLMCVGPWGGGCDSVREVVVLDSEDEVTVYDLEVEGTDNFAVTNPNGQARHGVIVHNSEYMHLDDSACNLASLNLRRFIDDATGEFDVESFRRAVEIVFTAQEILVTRSSYPTEKIRANALAFRQLGMGYANLGGLLMGLGLPYDSDEGRAWAAAITALMTGHAYRTSAELARVQGAHEGYGENAQPMLRVIRKHRDAVKDIDPTAVPASLLDAAQQAWDEALDLGERYGYRNSQATVAAPTGTISFLMDCETTGIEPDLGLVKTKKMVGGASIQIVNPLVPQALRSLGYDEAAIAGIAAYIEEERSILGAPGLAAEHLPVFACAMGDNAISYDGHLQMMAAAQPFLSGAISKTVNLPETATVEDIEAVFVESWKLGLKAVAIYRDNCKVGQPLSVATKAAPAGASVTTLAAPGPDERVMVRRKLPKSRPSQTVSFQVGEAKGYVTTGEYPGQGIGELFIKLGKQGSTLSGLLDAFAISVSLGLQYGVPLEAYVAKFMNMRFEPQGMTDDPEIRFSTSIIDYIARRVAIDYLPYQQRVDLGILTTDERMPSFDLDAAGEIEPRVPTQVAAPAPAPHRAPVAAAAVDVPLCYVCGMQMKRAGSCHVCEQCGSTSGCS